MRQPNIPRGVTAKHSSSKHASKHHSKHKSTSKHHPKKQHQAAPAAGMNPLPKKSPKPRRLSPGDIDLCPAEAVAAAARLAGWVITDEDVLDLYARCADGPSSGFTIAAALTAGLPLVPMDFGVIDPQEVMPLGQQPATGTDSAGDLVTRRAGLILGVDLPGPHAVTVAPDGTWWSWGEHFYPADFPDAVVEEAWLVEFAGVAP